jgi:hypothetical protein
MDNGNTCSNFKCQFQLINPLISFCSDLILYDTSHFDDLLASIPYAVGLHPHNYFINKIKHIILGDTMGPGLSPFVSPKVSGGHGHHTWWPSQGNRLNRIISKNKEHPTCHSN